MQKVYRPSLLITLISVCGCVFFIFIGVLMQFLPAGRYSLFPWNPLNQKIIGWLAIFFFTSGIPLILYSFFKSKVIITDKELVYQISKLKIPWTEIKSVEVITKEMIMHVKWLGVYVKPEFVDKYTKFEKYAKKLKLTKYDLIINLDLYSKNNFEKIVEQINEKIREQN